MKPIRFILLFIPIAITSSLFAQAPQRFNYQAVARDGSGNPLVDKAIAVQISIIDNTATGSSLYSERFNTQTGKQGLFSIQVGAGTVTSGSFNTIQWGSAAKFLKVEIDPAGGTAFTLLGTSQLLSVPYALTADKLSSPMSITDLSDVSDTAPNVDQVLKWDGSSWVPGDGAAAIVTSSELSGDGSVATPIKLAQQSATNGQVLQWNGSQWKPATVSGGVGDNWGTQTVSVNSTLSGLGTAASPLGIAFNGATNGMVLKYNGATWTPAVDAGDNWGAAKVNTSTQFIGDGTPGSPLILAQQGASTGQFLKWSGTGWIPGDGGGSITFPASGTATDPGAALQVQNNTGTGVVGINANASTANVYGLQGRILNSTGANTAGVYGLHGSTGANGFGVYGLHSGNGSGVYGTASGASGVGVSGLGNTGVSGITNTATGPGIYGNATAGGYAGWFDEKVVIKSNSSSTKPTLEIAETESADKTRVRFNNSIVGKYWEIDAITSAAPTTDKFTINHFTAGDVVTVNGNGQVGIAQSNPTEKLDVLGNIKLSGGIVASGSTGTSGSILESTGSGVQWVGATNAVYNGTILADNTASFFIAGGMAKSPTLSTGLQFTTTSASRVTFTYSQQLASGGGDTNFEIEIGFKDAVGNIVNKAICDDFVMAARAKIFSYTHHCQFNTAGTYLGYIIIRATDVSGGGLTIYGGNSNGQVTITIAQQ